MWGAPKWPPTPPTTKPDQLHTPPSPQRHPRPQDPHATVVALRTYDEAGVAAPEVGGHRARGEKIRDEHRRPGDQAQHGRGEDQRGGQETELEDDDEQEQPEAPRG